jgi:hypothetical protein
VPATPAGTFPAHTLVYRCLYADRLTLNVRTGPLNAMSQNDIAPEMHVTGHWPDSITRRDRCPGSGTTDSYAHQPVL